jgi:outer membrane protein OmpA-like peptidoglycan-associated protein
MHAPTQKNLPLFLTTTTFTILLCAVTLLLHHQNNQEIKQKTELIKTLEHQNLAATQNLAALEKQVTEQKINTARLQREIESARNARASLTAQINDEISQNPQKIRADAIANPKSVYNQITQQIYRDPDLEKGLTKHGFHYHYQHPFLLVDLPDLTFELGATRVSSRRLLPLAQLLKEYSGNAILLVQGHTDSVPGVNRTNWRVGSQRAENVITQLLRLGSPKTKLALVSHADNIPDPSPRRVTFAFLLQKDDPPQTAQDPAPKIDKPAFAKKTNKTVQLYINELLPPDPR